MEESRAVVTEQKTKDSPDETVIGNGLMLVLNVVESES